MITKIANINLFKATYNKISSPKTNPNQLGLLYFGAKSLQNSDSFEKRTRYDWEELSKNLAQYKTEENLLGYGDEAGVYALNDKYVLRTSTYFEDGTKFYPVEDIFKGRNIGNAIAQDENGSNTINKRIYGEKLYQNFDDNIESYLELLREYSNLDNETLEEFISNVALIDSKGLRIDKSNPENFLYDRKTKRIGIVDLGEKNDFMSGLLDAYSHEWILYPLVNGGCVLDYYNKMTPEQRNEMYLLITNLENKILPICEKYKIPKANINSDHIIENKLFKYLKIHRNKG